MSPWFAVVLIRVERENWSCENLTPSQAGRSMVGSWVMSSITTFPPAVTRMLRARLLRQMLLRNTRLGRVEMFSTLLFF